MGPANNLIYLIQHLSSVMGKQSERILRDRLGIGLSQFKILMVLEWNPHASQRSIADSLGQTEASVSRQVKALSTRGLLTAKRDPANHRRYVIAPTPKGMQLTESANSVLWRHLEPELSNFDDTELTQLAMGLQKLHMAVCKPGKPGACDHQLGL